MAYKPLRHWDIPGLVRASEAARQFGISRAAIYYQIQHGLIRYERVGGYFYIPQAVVDSLLASKTAVESLAAEQQVLDSVVATARAHRDRLAQAQRAATRAALET